MEKRLGRAALKPFRIGLAVAALLVATTPAALPQTSSQLQAVTFDITKDAAFPRISDVLANLVAKKKSRRPVNSFCLIAYDDAGEKYAYVFWREQNALILWEPQIADIADLTISRRYLDLKRDVVKDDAHLNGSSYLVTQAWVKDRLQDCNDHGTNLVVQRHQLKK